MILEPRKIKSALFSFLLCLIYKLHFIIDMYVWETHIYCVGFGSIYMAESEEELKSLLMKVKVETEKLA